MKIVVCAKQVPNTNEVKIDPVKGTLIRDGVESILNPDDANALEEALKLKDTYKDVTVTVISMGPPQAAVSYTHLYPGSNRCTIGVDSGTDYQRHGYCHGHERRLYGRHGRIYPEIFPHHVYRSHIRSHDG